MRGSRSTTLPKKLQEALLRRSDPLLDRLGFTGHHDAHFVHHADEGQARRLRLEQQPAHTCSSEQASIAVAFRSSRSNRKDGEVHAHREDRDMAPTAAPMRNTRVLGVRANNCSQGKPPCRATTCKC